MAQGLSEELKKVLLAGIGAMAMTAEKSSEMIDTFIKKGELTVEQGKVLNEELKHDVKEKMKETIAKNKLCVDAVIENLDKMSKTDIDAIKAKLAEMETPDEGKK